VTIVFNKNRKRAIFRAIFAAPAIFAVAAHGVTFGVGASLLTRAAVRQSVSVPAADSECQPVFGAGDKLFVTPYHMYMTETDPGVDNGKAISSESVSMGGLQYVLVNRKWTASPLTVQEVKQMELRNRRTATNQSCHYLRDEPVNGEDASVYSAHSETTQGKNDNQLWISKSRGLILRQETDLDIGGGRPKTHVSVRYDYSNVQKPPL
jgi:hypothetical protein